MDTVNWRWLFLLNLPIGLLVAVFAARHLRESGQRRPVPLDWIGFALVAVGLTALLGVSSFVREGAGVPPVAAGLAIVGVGALIAFVLQERRTPHPLLELRMFRNPVFSVTIAVVWLGTVAHFGILVLVPVQLQVVQGFSGVMAGLMITPSAVAAALVMPGSGRLADRVGPRTPVVIGLALMGGSVGLLSSLSHDTSWPTIAAVLALHGCGVGMAVMPYTAAAMNAVPAPLVPQASAVRSVSRQISAALSVAVLASIITQRIGGLAPAGVPAPSVQAAYQLAYLVVLATVVAAIAFAFVLPGRSRNQAIQRRRWAEEDAVIVDDL